MPNIPLIRAQRSPVTGLPVAEATGDAFGAQIGRAVQGLGAAIGDSAGIFAQIEAKKKDREIANLTAQADYTKRFNDRKLASPAGADGFYEETGKDYDQFIREYTANIKDPVIRRGVEENLRSRTPGVLQNAANYQLASTVEYDTQQTNAALGALTNRVRNDPSEFDTVLGEAKKVVETLPGVDANTRAGMMIAETSNLSRARFETLMENATSPEDLDKLEKELAEETWRQRMTPQHYDSVKDAINTAKTTFGTAARAELASTMTDLSERSKSDKTLIPVEELRVAEQQVRQYGSPSQQREFAEIVKRQDVYRTSRGLPTSEIRTRMNQIGEGSIDYKAAQNAIAAIESGGRYNATGVWITRKNGTRDRAYGKYQVMGANIPSWTKEALGRSMTPAEFLADPAAQDAVFNYKFGQAVKRYGSVEDAASVWFSGRPMRRAGSASDAHGTTVPAYVRKFMKGYTGAADGGLSRSDYVTYNAYNDLLREREAASDDMMTYWPNRVQNLPQPAPLTLNSNAADFAQRGQQARAVLEYGGLSQAQATPLTKNEVEEFTRVIAEGSSMAGLNLITQIKEMGPDMAQAAFRQLGATEPIFEYAATIHDRSPPAAAEIMRGSERLRRDPKLLAGHGATDQNVSEAFTTAMGAALYALPPRTVAAVRDAALAHYAETYVSKGGVEFSPEAYANSLQAVLGAENGQPVVAPINGAPTLLPRGVTPAEFEIAIDQFTEEDLIELSPLGVPPRRASGDVVPPEDIEYEGRFRALDDKGHYYIETTDGVLIAGQPDERGFAPKYVIRLDAEAVKRLADRAEFDVDIEGLYVDDGKGGTIPLDQLPLGQAPEGTVPFGTFDMDTVTGRDLLLEGE